MIKINYKGVITKPEGEFNGNHYRVIASEASISVDIWDCLDTIKNTTTGKTRTMTRREWRNYIARMKRKTK